MEGIDTTIYLTRHKDALKVTKEYVAAVVKAREERNAAHAVEEESQRQALKDDDHRDPVVCLLHVTRTAAHAQCEKAVDPSCPASRRPSRSTCPCTHRGP